MKNNVKLYNVMFPIWFLLLFPITWVAVLPANFLIDSAVLLITAKLLKIDDIKILYKKSILKVWLLGFLADFIGTAILLISYLIAGKLPDDSGTFGRWFSDNIMGPISFNPFENIFAFIFVTFAVAVSAFFIYLFNYKISFKNVNIDNALKKKLSLSLAVFTAPYLFYLPSKLLYK